MLQVDSYLRDFELAVARLPSVFERWSAMDDDARAGFADQFSLLVLREGEAQTIVRSDPSRASNIAVRIGQLNYVIGMYADALETLMGIRVRDLVAPLDDAYGARSTPVEPEPMALAA